MGAIFERYEDAGEQWRSRLIHDNGNNAPEANTGEREDRLGTNPVSAIPDHTEAR